ncbi:hypothetical protein H2200_001179 [Cladophialophora chaetospira]|uniref:FAD-binding domain-containing protein n=1 Tax=Cladophialophora chaetospira TaxID=386627 RepID=A0AA38XKN0_9EURO|nr:hypothetical protein H2200_001179 [Cladophialophora chaetospira]
MGSTLPLPTSFKVVIVGAGLGGLGAALGLLYGGYMVEILEAAPEIAEIGAGLSLHPNSIRILSSWGLIPQLEGNANVPRSTIINGWKGNEISVLDLIAEGRRFGYPSWDLHRADLHSAMLQRANDLGAVIRCNARVIDCICDDVKNIATVNLHDGTSVQGDLIIGADGVNSTMRQVMYQKKDPPQPTGDTAYRFLTAADKISHDPQLSQLLHQRNLWFGPERHVVAYGIRGGKFLNMVCLDHHDSLGDLMTAPATLKEVKALYQGWDPRLIKLLELSDKPTLLKWKLCTKVVSESWSHSSGLFTLLGDAVHATLPYVAAGAGMALEDGAVLGEVFSRLPKGKRPSINQVKRALSIYEACRRTRTQTIVKRGYLQQHLNHLNDGEDQQRRDEMMRMVPTRPGEALVWRDPEFGPWLLSYDHVQDVNVHWPEDGLEERNSTHVHGSML